MPRTKTIDDPLYRSYLRAVLKMDGLRLGMLELHEYLIQNPGWHSSADIAEALDVIPTTIFRWSNVLVERGYLERWESEGVQEGTGGRRPAEFRANVRKSKSPLGKKYDRKVKALLRAL